MSSELSHNMVAGSQGECAEIHSSSCCVAFWNVASAAKRRGCLSIAFLAVVPEARQFLWERKQTLALDGTPRASRKT